MLRAPRQSGEGAQGEGLRVAGRRLWASESLSSPRLERVLQIGFRQPLWLRALHGGATSVEPCRWRPAMARLMEVSLRVCSLPPALLPPSPVPSLFSGPNGIKVVFFRPTLGAMGSPLGFGSEGGMAPCGCVC